MATQMISKRLKQIFILSTVFIVITTFSIIFIGYASSVTNKEIKKLKIFHSKTENIQLNFEKSLELYTEKTEDTIQFLLNLKPDSEQEVVKFISEIENIGQNLKLDLTLNSVETPAIKGAKAESAIDYNISFKGSLLDSLSFIKQIESLPYFIKILRVNYSDTKYWEADQLEEDNIEIQIKLYIKNKNETWSTKTI